MGPRIDGEMAKLVKADNGWLVYLWDPEPPKTLMPGQTPCSQQPTRWWKVYMFPQLGEAMTFIHTFLEGLDGD